MAERIPMRKLREIVRMKLELKGSGSAAEPGDTRGACAAPG